MSKVLELKNLSYVYGTGTPFEKTAVNNLSLSIEKGEFIGIMGHTGSGKSTLVQMLNGLMKPTSGQVLLDGEDIWANPKDIRKIRFKVGMVFQYPEYQLFEETVAKDIAFGPTNMGKSGAELEKAVNDAARFTGLKDELLEKSPFDLSGGEKRRAAIAGVIAMNPEVLVLDEPTAGLDPMGRDVLLSQIVQYHKERKNTVILVSHSMEDIARVADKIIVMNKSNLVMFDKTKEVFSKGRELEKIGLRVPQITKIMLVGFLVIIFCTFNYASLALVVLFTALFVAASKVPAKFYFKSMKVIIFIIIVTSILNVFYGSGDPLVQWGIFKITLNGINRAIFVSVRIICLILASSCLTFTTSPTELTDAIERLMKPLAKLHFPVHEIAMMMSLALRFVPTLLEETDKITQAQKARGADMESGNIIQRVKAFIPILIPLFVSAFRRAYELATAMECRCYRGGTGRTRMKTIHMAKRDYVSFVMVALLIGGVILCNIFLPAAV